MKRFLKALAVMAGLALGWCLIVYIEDMPLSESRSYGCATCREYKSVTKIMLIPVHTETSSNEFSSYYMKHADPHHKEHIWLGTGFSRWRRSGDISGHGRSGSLYLRYEFALAILKSLPDKSTRKMFFEQLQITDASSPKAEKTSRAIAMLNKAGFENENRKDWPQLLRKYGVYPTTTKPNKAAR